jgi:hypothetical protein
MKRLSTFFLLSFFLVSCWWKTSEGLWAWEEAKKITWDYIDTLSTSAGKARESVKNMNVKINESNKRINELK